MADSDEEFFLTQNSFISAEIAESDVISDENADIEQRFDRLLDNAEIQERVRQFVPSATRYKDEWAVRAFEAWRSNREKMALRDRCIRCFKTPLKDMSADVINDSISHFVFEVKIQDGTEYPGNSLHGLVCSIQRYLKTQCGKQLVETLVYLFGLHFALRGGKEHRRLRCVNSQIVMKYDGQGKKYLEYTEDVSKTNAGSLDHRKTKPKVTRPHENPDSTRCIVRLYEKYCSLW